MGFNVAIRGSKNRVVFHPHRFSNGDVLVNTLLKMGGEKVSVLDPNYGGFMVEVVRDHCSALVEGWLNQTEITSLSDYIDSVRKTFYKGRLYGYSLPNYYLRYETLQYEFDVLCLTVGLPETELVGFKPINLNWRKYVTQPVYDKIERAFGQEMEFLGYGTFAKR